MTSPYVGEIRMFAGNFAPLGWELCQGQILPISENETLFQLIGTTYGGDGQSTFNLPNLASRVPIHMGTAQSGTTYQLGEMAGVESVTLTTQQIPIHSHALTANDSQPGNQVSPADALPGISFNVVPFINNSPSASFNAAAITAAGGSQPHENMQPFLCINFIISLFGVFPSQT
jgi:microcystin-dependent protein